MITLLKVLPSQKENKKYTAYFTDNNKEKIAHFGLKGSSDYLIHKDKERRKRYLIRHKNDLNTNNPIKPGYAALFLLWGRTTSLAGNIKIYKSLLKKYNETQDIKIFYDEYNKLLKEKL